MRKSARPHTTHTNTGEKSQFITKRMNSFSAIWYCIYSSHWYWQPTRTEERERESEREPNKRTREKNISYTAKIVIILECFTLHLVSECVQSQFHACVRTVVCSWFYTSSFIIIIFCLRVFIFSSSNFIHSLMHFNALFPFSREVNMLFFWNSICFDGAFALHTKKNILLPWILFSLNIYSVFVQ